MGLFLIFQNWYFGIWYLLFGICYLLFAICYLLFVNLLFAMFTSHHSLCNRAKKQYLRGCANYCSLRTVIIYVPVVLLQFLLYTYCEWYKNPLTLKKIALQNKHSRPPIIRTPTVAENSFQLSNRSNYENQNVYKT